ncbi:alpha/beta hydrolase [bacterium]|nr:alpha/beta hydrolase [bacterium]
MEEPILFASDNLRIEGLCEHKSTSRAVIITHPHSLYGGDMYNAVVTTIQKTYADAGYTTLRFNFRGVGRSEGHFDNGIGEQTDLKAAHEFLSVKGITSIDLAGYSFGSWVAASVACQMDLFEHVILVSPPVSFMDFSGVSHVRHLSLTIVGDRDDFADLATLKKRLSVLNATSPLEILSNTDHFYSGSLDNLSIAIKAGITADSL